MPIIVPFVETFLGQMVLDLKFIVGLVFFIWSQNMPHGNKVLDDEDLALPILDTAASNWEANAKAMWRDYGVCAAKLDVTAKDLKSLYATFQRGVSALDASGFGSCAKVGLFTGAGLPHGKFAGAVRALPGWKVRGGRSPIVTGVKP